MQIEIELVLVLLLDNLHAELVFGQLPLSMPSLSSGVGERLKCLVRHPRQGKDAVRAALRERRA